MFPVYAQGTTWQNCSVAGVPTLKCMEIIFERALFFASSLVIVVLFIMFIIGSFTYLTSLGNPEKLKKAQNTLKYAIAGFVLFLASFLILKTIDLLFLGNKGDIFRFTIGPK